MTHLNWLQKEYFSQLMRAHDQAENALEMLVDDLHSDKERTIQTFLCHAGSEDFLWALIRLLGNGNARVAGNSAYIIGTVAESEIGCYRVLRLTQQSRSIPSGHNVLEDLTQMLTFDDAESVMNAAGTIGTLAETPEGRDMLIEERCLPTTITNITELLLNENVWTASNAALVLARLTICESGCNRILDHTKSDHILERLIQSLGIDEAGRGMNAAFAIGRLCDLDIGRSRLLALPESERMISSLVIMLASDDSGASKNACFALSCLATTRDGHSRILDNHYSDNVISTLCSLLQSQDPETAWFAAMTIRTLASQPRGCIKMRDDQHVLQSLKKMLSVATISSDLKEEIDLSLEILKKLEKPSPPKCEVTGSETIFISWDKVETKSGLKVSYYILEGSHCTSVWNGDGTSCTLDKLKPYTSYTYRLRAHTAGDDSPLSDPVTITTDEAAPSEVVNLHIAGCTTTQLKAMWEPPERRNGLLKGYHVYKGNVLYEHTYELSSIITGLPPSTVCEIYVCASTNKGKGPRTGTSGMTNDTGAHAPAKPNVSVLGRHEVHVSWDTPENPLGKINRYDLSVNGKVVYSGTDLAFTVRRLNPDTEYTFTVSAITNEGKCESRQTKKKTSKDEYDGYRQPLYVPPKKDDNSDSHDLRRTPSARSRRRSSVSQESIKQALNRIGSASSKNRPTFVDGERRQSVKSQLSNVSSKSTSKHLPRPHSPTPSSLADENTSSSKSKTQSTTATFIVPVNDLDNEILNDPDHVSSSTVLQTYETAPIKVKISKRRKSSSKDKHKPGIVTKMLNKKPEQSPIDAEQSELLRNYSLENLRESTENLAFDITKSWKINEELELPSTKAPSTENKEPSVSTQQTEKENIIRNRSPYLESNLINRPIVHNKIKHSQKHPQYRIEQTYGADGKPTLVRSLTSVSIKEGIPPRPRLTYSMKQHPRRMSDSLYAQPTTPSVGSSRRLSTRRQSSLIKAPSTNQSMSSVCQSYDCNFSSKRPSHAEMTRSFTTMNLRQSSSNHTSTVSSSLSNANNLPKELLIRTNTFINTHRPPRKKEPYLSRHFNPLLNGIPNQWKPDFPLAQSASNASKFVPMQFRTQPANLPSAGGQNTQQIAENESELVINPRQSKFISQLPLEGTSSKSSYSQQRRYYHGNRLSENVPS